MGDGMTTMGAKLTKKGWLIAALLGEQGCPKVLKAEPLAAGVDHSVTVRAN
jgi:hypothetical protein